MKRVFRLYKIFFKQNLHRLMEYRFDFLSGAFSFFLTQAFGIVFITLLFGNIPNLNGYTFDQILFIYGFSQIPKGLDHFISDNLWKLAYFKVQNGEVDKFYIRPINPLIHALVEEMQFDALGEIIVGVAIVSYCAIKLSITLTFIDILLMVVVIPFCALIYCDIKLIFGSIAFWTKRSGHILQTFYFVHEFGKYPAEIYGQVVKTFITFIIPFAFASFYPASYFLNHTNILFNLGGVVVSSLIMFAAGYFVWCKGLNAYESVGN